MGYLPHGGFLHLQTSRGLTKNTLLRVIGDLCETSGIARWHLDEAVLDDCFALWQANVVEWSATYRREFEASRRRAGHEETLRHVKYAGCLLHAMTQGDREPIVAVEYGPVVPLFGRDLLEAEPNRCLMFLAIYWLFIEQQNQRGVDLTYDPAAVVMTYWYLRAMVHYLRQGTLVDGTSLCSPSDFYLIFKTMDLYGVVHHPLS